MAASKVGGAFQHLVRIGGDGGLVGAHAVADAVGMIAHRRLLALDFAAQFVQRLIAGGLQGVGQRIWPSASIVALSRATLAARPAAISLRLAA